MRNELLLVKCAKCRRIKVNSNWLTEPGFLSRSTNYTHTYCPSCFAEEMASVERNASLIESLPALELPGLQSISA